ncbi:DUF58 domain-containing protein [Luteolibacter ambystomatis]|uniref:DUF58 domain-containing protein n=1 Tax=Luteolibacter ambystomatis TaxID=2824561 RepID=A0A975PFN3_9BACT|nr:DUF58 domain-containing protein [Luteolibacter ambystomatis]QUE51702.1 DUF58 domain-containing protein [Luteolibacter ambystomatis]
MLTDAQIEEMMSRVRKLELKARRLVRESFSGEYHSSFKGQGLDFDDFREYQHGDEVRFIDWNVTARMNQPFIRKFREERELALVLAVDVSGSADYGSESLSKREVMAEAAAVLGFSALQNGDKVGLLVFANEPILFVPPGKGTRHLLRLVREILIARPNQPGTSVAAACDFLVRTLRRKSLVFMISDFQSHPIEKPLAKLARKHETLALRVSDPLEAELPRAGRVVMIDPETGLGLHVNTNSARIREEYARRTREQHEYVAAVLKKNGIDTAELNTRTDSLPALHKLLKKRSRKRTA